MTVQHDEIHLKLPNSVSKHGEIPKVIKGMCTDVGDAVQYHSYIWEQIESIENQKAEN